MDYGECVLERYWNTLHDELRIIRADPVVRISAPLLEEIRQSQGLVPPGSHLATLERDVLTLHGVNRTVIYRIDWSDYDPDNDSYRAEWPD